jgi:FKBP-type peptidyl-prolyl cis-trans isomerase SlyD
MQIDKDTVVTLDYELTDSEGHALAEEGAQVAYLHGGYDGIFAKVESGLQGKKVGEEVALSLEPADAFGEYDEQLLRVESRENFPDVLQVGMRFEGVPGGGDDADGDVVIYTVTDITDDKVVVDGNHPLAGQSVVFSCVVTEVRKASAEEIAHGHVHGAHGHHH